MVHWSQDLDQTMIMMMSVRSLPIELGLIQGNYHPLVLIILEAIHLLFSIICQSSPQLRTKRHSFIPKLILAGHRSIFLYSFVRPHFSTF
jgi:hypothetical protein